MQHQASVVTDILDVMRGRENVKGSVPQPNEGILLHCNDFILKEIKINKYISRKIFVDTYKDQYSLPWSGINLSLRTLRAR